MIVQLPCGRIIECSVEAYLDLEDHDIRELNGIGISYTKDYNDPFYNSFSKASKAALEDIEKEYKHLYDIDDEEKLEDKYFHPDDI